MKIESVYIEPNDNKDERYFRLSVVSDDKFAIGYTNNYGYDDYTQFITIDELFDILSFDGDRLKHREDEAYQAKLDGLTAELKKTKLELKVKESEIIDLKNQVKYIKEAFRNDTISEVG